MRHQLTANQLDAIRVYARSHGRYWKQQLRHDWMSARLSGELQVLRNSYGPSWLATFVLPIEVEVVQFEERAS